MSLTKNEIKFIKSLHLKKNRTDQKLFIVEGVKLINELLIQDKFDIHTLYHTKDFNLKTLKSSIKCIEVSVKDLERISNFKTPNKVLAVVKQVANQNINYNENNLVLLLDDVSDPGNLGTIIRTADWFGVTQIIASKNTVECFNPKVIQASMGAIYRMNYFVEDLKDIIPKFKAQKFDILAAVIDGDNIFELNMPSKSVLVMGSESHGVSNEILSMVTQKISIPKFGQTESLNVAMATGIILAEYKKEVILQK